MPLKSHPLYNSTEFVLVKRLSVDAIRIAYVTAKLKGLPSHEASAVDETEWARNAWAKRHGWTYAWEAAGMKILGTPFDDMMHMVFQNGVAVRMTTEIPWTPLRDHYAQY